MTGQPDPTRTWQEYLDAARQLDAVRQAAPAGDASQGPPAVRDELARLRARLVPQQTRLQQAGVPLDQLTPTAEEVAAATQAMAAGPAAVLAAVRNARATADLADAVLIGSVAPPAVEMPIWRRNLLVYGPFAFVVFLVQVGLAWAAGDRLSVGALLCGLTMPIAAFGLGWLMVGLVFRPPAGGPVDRTPVVGAALCALPALIIMWWALTAAG